MTVRRRAQVVGVAQGVGFRPHVLRLARAAGVGGFVCNQRGRVIVEVEGQESAVDQFANRLEGEIPTLARIEAITWSNQQPEGETEFHILTSRSFDASALVLPPDIATCDDCKRETHTTGDRRFAYGFGSCTACGPRFTIIDALPWDRAGTTMGAFSMCSACQREYRDVHDRRYHAQTIACPQCGPKPVLEDPNSGDSPIAAGSEAVWRAATALLDGAIVALKGIGGFQLLVRADDGIAVLRLRTRKRRPTKPMAVMVDSVKQAMAIAEVTAAETRALTSPSGPIVLCAKRTGSIVADAVAPGTSRIGILLSTSPLHSLLAQAIQRPVVATSGNFHEEPICIDDQSARERLSDVADLLLTHNRPIVRRCDDSVVDIIDGQMRTLRMGRGFAPTTITLGGVPSHKPVLALGGHLKVAPALATEAKAVLWPHVGDLDTLPAREAMQQAVEDLQNFFAVRAQYIACDLHPDYATTIWAEKDDRPLIHVQHHHAHVAACLAEHDETRALGFAWDGVGYGDREAVRLWGGEVLQVDGSQMTHQGSFLPFPLVGGEAAARDGRRALAGLCHAAGRTHTELQPWIRLGGISPRTTSVGRLFDAVAALIGVCTISQFEGEAAMRLEAISQPGESPYPISWRGNIIDWRPMFGEIMKERDHGARVASRFHATLIQAIANVASACKAPLVALVGGCFSNRLLLQGAQRALRKRGIRTITSMKVPPGDGGLALGQAWVAVRSTPRYNGGQSCV